MSKPPAALPMRPVVTFLNGLVCGTGLTLVAVPLVAFLVGNVLRQVTATTETLVVLLVGSGALAHVVGLVSLAWWLSSRAGGTVAAPAGLWLGQAGGAFIFIETWTASVWGQGAGHAIPALVGVGLPFVTFGAALAISIGVLGGACRRSEG